jgi:hypothetical protein
MTIKPFPNSPYILHQPFEPAGDQPTTIAQITHDYLLIDAFHRLLKKMVDISRYVSP